MRVFGEGEIDVAGGCRGKFLCAKAVVEMVQIKRFQGSEGVQLSKILGFVRT